MRLALQRLLRDSDALLYLRKILTTPNGFAREIPGGPCRDCKQHREARRVRHSSSLIFSPSLEKASRDESNEQINRIRHKLRQQRQWTGKREVLETLLHQLEPSDRENVLWGILDGYDFRNDFDVWFCLAHFRRRTRGTEGIRLVWHAILERGVDLPVAGESANGLWNQILELGFDDAEVLKEIFIYARKLKEDHGRVWPTLYIAVMGHHIRAVPNRVWLCHTRLQKHFPPSNEQIRQLLALAIYDDELRQVFLSMHKDFPFARIYDDAIPELCKQGLLSTAVSWHRKLFKRGDLPSNPKSAEPVLQHLACVGDKARLMEYSRLMAAAGISSKKETERPIESPSTMADKVPRNQVFEMVRVPNPNTQFSDHFYARLFATRAFSINTIISALVFLNTIQIGPLSLREMAARELSHIPFHVALRHRLDQLKESGIVIGRSAFSDVVHRLVEERNDHLLRSVITCDLHSDTFEDEELQESLLPCYQQQRDTTAFNRTLAILTARLPNRDTRNLKTKRWNLILRSSLTRQKLQDVQRVLEKMKELQIQVEPRSTAYMSKALLSRRQVGRRPANTKELNLLIRMWQDALRAGAAVPPDAWKEILRRLGMSGRLITFERLALWLAAWYSSTAFQASQKPMLHQVEQTAGLLLSPGSADHKASSPFHASRAIFPPSLLQGIVAWGFQHQHANHDRRLNHHTRPTWTWGLLLLRKLRDCNVYVHQEVVSKAFKLRLLDRFGCERSRRKLNRSNKFRNTLSPEQYITMAKKIWGPDLLRRHGPLLTDRGRKEIYIGQGSDRPP
ncbi:MAG: hypothetical protein L6R37_005694 [Teloschistes peruensis]|nr:MAG: hypothetical protein L6R37_005694 [Teloschistes peruensis]